MQQQRQRVTQEPARSPRVVTPSGHPVDTWRGTVDAAPWVEVDDLVAAPQRLVVVAAHPDDETIGAGRLISRWGRRAGPVQVITLTAGENCLAHLGAEVPGLAARRLREWEGAAASLGAATVGCWGVADGAVGASTSELVGRLAQHLEPGDVVLAPWRHEPHPDHAAAGAIARTATAQVGAALVEYPVWMTSWCEPLLLERTAYRLSRVCTDDRAETDRLAALAHYASQRLPLLPDLTAVVPEEMLSHHHCQLVLRPAEAGDG